MRSHHFDYTTHDIDAVKRFYVVLLGFKNHEHDPQFNYLWVQTGNTSSLGFMPPMQGMGEMSPPKEPTLYFMVDDVDRAYANLSAKGMMFGAPRTCRGATASSAPPIPKGAPSCSPRASRRSRPHSIGAPS